MRGPGIAGPDRCRLIADPTAEHVIDRWTPSFASQPGELQIEQRPAPQAGAGRGSGRGRAASASAAPTITSSRASIRSSHYPRVMGHELAVEVVEAPAGVGVAAGEICVVNPYLSCGTCIACRSGKPNCCVRIAGARRPSRRRHDRTSVAAGREPRAGRRAQRRCSARRSSSSPSARMRCGAAAIAGAERVLVIGAGPIGLGVALFARSRGAGHGAGPRRRSGSRRRRTSLGAIDDRGR